MKSIILFDLDGTLIDSTPAILDGFRFAYSQFSRDFVGDEAVKNLIGYPLDLIFLKLGIEKELIDDFIISYKQKYTEVANDKTVLLEGAMQAVELASQFATLAVVTTKTSRYSIELLEHLKILQHFVTVVGKEDVINPKPHPEPILLALKLLNAQKYNDENAWMIGDTILDVEAANAAGIGHVALHCGYGDKNVLKMHSKHYADDALDAVRLLKDRLERR